MPQSNLGATLKALRTDRGWTLAVMSERTGVPLSSLSKMEKDQLSPTYDQLLKISEGLGLDIAELFASDRKSDKPLAAGRRSINRLMDGATVASAGQILHYLNTDLLDKAFCPIISDIKSRSLAEFGAFMSHPGEEFVFVIEGVLELHSEFYAPVRLVAGESIYFDSRMGHAYVACGDRPCRILSICSDAQTDSQASSATVDAAAPDGDAPKRKARGRKPSAA